MTKFFTSLLVAFLLFTATATAQVTLTIASASNVTNGQQVCLNVTAANFTNIIGMQFSINYNPAMLQLTSVSNFNLPGLSAGGNFGLPIAGGAGMTTAGNVTVSWTDNDLSGETRANGATLFTLCFTGLASSGSTNVSFSGMPTAIEFTNLALQTVPFNSVPGMVSFTGGGTPTPMSLTVGNASNVIMGQQACLNVTAQNFTNINSLQLTVTYNASMLQFVSVGNFGLPGLTAGNFNTSTPGTITVTWTNASGQTAASGATLFNLCFTALVNSGSTQVSIGSTTAMNAGGQAVPVSSAPGTVSFGPPPPTPVSLTVGSASNVMTGQQVCLNVTAQNFTNINSLQLTATYNSSMLQFVSVGSFGLPGLAAGNFNTSTPGTITLTWTNASGQTAASGATLFNICFTAQASSGSTPVSIGNTSATNAGGQTVTVNSTQGTVSFGAAPPTGFTLTVAGANNVMSGQQVCLNVTAANFTNIIGMQFSINYNPAMLQLTSVTNFGLPGFNAGGNFGLPIAGGAGMTTAGNVTVSWTDNDLSGETLANGATLFTLCFNALASSGSTNVSFSGMPTAIEITNLALQTVPFNSVPGTVSFGSGGGTPTPVSLTVGSASNVMQGQQVCLNVTAQNFTSINSLQLTATYNSSMLQFASVGNFGLPGLAVGNFNTSTPGTITVTWTNASGQTAASGATLFNICFTAQASSGSTPVSVSSGTAMNAGGQAVTVNSTAGTVSFTGGGGNPTGFTLTVAGANNVANGQQVCLDVTAANFTNIIGMQFSINYNPAMLQLTSVTNFGLPGFNTGGNFGLPIAGGAGMTTAGNVTVSWTDNDLSGETLTNGATLFTLCFNALASSGSTNISFSGMPTAIEITNLALQTVPFNSVPGTVSFAGGGGNPTGFTLTVAGANNVANGQQVCLDVTAANFTNIIGMQFSINYNPAMLQLTSVTNFGLPGFNTGGNFGLPIAGGIGLTTAGNVTVSWTDNDLSGETLTNGATLFTLCFNALASSGSTNISFSGMPTAIEITNLALQTVPFNSVPGTVSFAGGGGNPTGFTLTVAGANNVANGQQVCLDVTAANFTNIIGMQFSINYNPAMLQLTSVTNFGLPGFNTGGNFGLPIAGGAGMTTAGNVTVSWTDNDLSGETLTNGATLFTLCFNALASTGSTNVSFSGMPTAIEITNTALQTVPFNSVPGTVSFGGGGTPTPISLTVGSASNVMQGQQVCLNVTAQNLTNINALQLTVTYNSSMLQFVSVGSFGLPGLAAGNFNTSTPGTITLTWTNASGQTVAGGATLFNICFTGQAGSGSTPVSIGNTSATNAGGQTVAVNSTPGTVSFNTPTGFTLTVASANNVANGQQVCLNVTAANFTNIIGMQFSINYNPAMLQLNSVTNFGLPGLSTGGNFGLPIAGGAGPTTPGNITVSWTDNDLSGETLTNGATLFTLCFNALASSGSTSVSFSGMPTAIEITNTALQTVPFNSVPGTVNFGSAPPTAINMTVGSASNVTQGQQVCLNVTAQNFTSINSLQLTATYNASLLQFVSVGSFGLPGLTAGNFNTSTPGTITLTWTNASGQTVANGATLFNICFTALANSGSTQASISNTSATNAGGQTIPVNSTPGTVSFGSSGSTPTPISLTVGSASNVIQGQQVCLNVTAQNLANINSLQLTVTYNASLLQFVSVGSFGLPGLTAGNFNTSTPGTITLTWTSANGQTITNGAALFNICFTALSNSGSTPVSIGNTSAANAIGEPVMVNSTPGTVAFNTPTGFTLIVGSASNVANGQQVCLNVTTANFTNILGMQFSVNYNPAMLQLTSVTNFGLPGFSAGGNFGLPIAGGAGPTTAGNITVSWTDDNQSGETLANGSTLFTLCFTALVGTGSTNVSFSGMPTAIEITNTALQTVPFNSVPGTVNFGSVPTPVNLTVGSASNVTQGQQVCLNVTAANFTNINSLQLTIPYNSSMLQFVSVGSFGLPGLTAGNFNTSTPGTITLTWTNASGQTVAGGTTLFNICFTATAGSGSTQVGISNTSATNAGGQAVPVNSATGTVSFVTPAGFSLAVGSAINVVQSQQACLNVTATDFTNINAVQLTVTYNPSMLQFVSVGSFGLAGLTAGNFNTSTPGTITLTWTNASGQTVAGGATLFNLCFTALASNGSTPVSIGNTSATNAGGQTVPVNSTPGTVSFVVPVNPPVIVTPAIITNVGCFGASTGAIDITVQSASGNFTYAWSYQNRTTQDLTGIPAGTYSVTVTDTGTGLTTSGSFTVSQPVAALAVIGVPTHVACFGAATGAINLTVSGGTAPYAYNWSGTLPDGIPNQTGLIAGSYSVTVTDANNCTASQTITVEQPAGAPVAISSQVTPVLCAGASTGSIVLSVTGGTLPYSINWCCGLPANQTTASNLAAGAYSVTVTDNNGCTATRTMNVGESALLQITSITPTHINNGNDGAINITVIGGTPGYMFSWSGPAGFNGSTQPNLTGLNIPGQYCLTVTDNNNCTATQCVQLLERLRFTNVLIERSCNGASTGAIEIGVQGGTSPYTYQWSPGSSTGPELFNVSAGTYNVTVTDQAGEQLVGSFVVENLPAIVIAGTVVNASGNITDANGSVTLTVSGGTPGYNISWNPGSATGLVLSNVVSGEYCAKVTDAAGCAVQECFIVGFNPGPLVVLNTQTTPVTCPGDLNGSLAITLDGGLPPFTFAFSDGYTETVSGITLSRSGLPGGTLTYTVTDAAGTVINGSATIGSVAVVTTTSIQVVHDSEEPGCTGSVTLQLSGGHPPYQLQWNTPNTGGPAINNLCAGTFTATVTDANGCVYVLPAIEVNTFALTAVSTPTNCPGDATGAVALEVSGGRAPYTFEWRNAAGAVVSTDEDLGNAIPGTYTVRVTEGSGNILVRTYTVASQSALALDVDVVSNFNGFDVSCHNSSNGSMEAVAFNGQGNYTFEWRRNGVLVGGSGATLNNATPGDYQVMVTDGLGCTVVETLTLNAPQPIVVTANAIAPSCVSGNDGQIFATASGGVFTLPYSFEWSNGAFGPRITFLRAGDYTVTATDVNNCSVTATFSVVNPAPIAVTVNSTPATDGCNGSVLAVVNGGTGPYTFNWSNGQVTTQPFLTGLCPGEYFVMVTDSRGCRPEPNIAMGTVQDRRTPCLDIRTVITPDGDGLNEEFLISCIDEFRDNRLEIYNRWGQLVYEIDGYDNTWMGTTRNGSELPDGPYFFVFEYTDVDGVRQQLKGSITVLRR